MNERKTYNTLNLLRTIEAYKTAKALFTFEQSLKAKPCKSEKELKVLKGFSDARKSLGLV